MIEFRNVQIKFDDFIAIQNLNLEIREGEFFTLLGPSGCGKTTTLRSLVGFIAPTRGDILIDNEIINAVPIEKREIGMVFQSYALFPTMNVYENIAFGLKVKKLNKQEIEERVKDIARKVDLKEEQLAKKVSELSGGQQQRVAIARALVLQPKILVLDEPLSNLDAQLRKQLRKELKALQNKFGITTIYVTHDQDEALTLSDRIAVFNNGVVEQVGTPFEIFNRSETEFVCNFIGDINKLSSNLIEKINQEFHFQLHPQKSSYIRPEKIFTTNIVHTSGVATLAAKVVGKEFFGTYTKYYFEVEDVLISNIEKEDGMIQYKMGDTVEIGLCERDILQY